MGHLCGRWSTYISLEVLGLCGHTFKQSSMQHNVLCQVFGFQVPRNSISDPINSLPRLSETGSPPSLSRARSLVALVDSSPSPIPLSRLVSCPHASSLTFADFFLTESSLSRQLSPRSLFSPILISPSFCPLSSHLILSAL